MRTTASWQASILPSSDGRVQQSLVSFASPHPPFCPSLFFFGPPTTMASAYVLTLQPTFTQGLILGQASILFLLFLILKYLFFDTDPERSYKNASYPPKIEYHSSEEALAAARLNFNEFETTRHEGGETETSEWLNVVLQQVCPRGPDGQYVFNRMSRCCTRTA